MAAEEFKCDIEFTELGAYNVTVCFTPDDNGEYFICSIASKATFDELGADYIMSYYKQVMDASISEGSASSYEEFAHQGQFYLFNSKLSPETEYVAFAYAVSPYSGTALSGMKVVTFTTTADTPSENEVNLHIVSPHWIDKVATAGFWQITGWTEDYDYYVQFCADPATATTGTFTLADTTWDWDYTGVYFYPGEGTYPTKRECDGLTLDISVEDNILYAKCDYTDTRGVIYHISFDPVSLGGSEGSGQEYDMTSNISASFSPEDGDYEFDEVVKCHTVWYQNADNEYLELKLYTPGATLEDGEYTIDSTNQDYTVEAATYEPDTYHIYGSVYGQLTDEGYMSIPWFWFTGGKVIVSHDANGTLQLDINATNTWNKTAKITVKSEETDGISDIHSDGKSLQAKKTLKGGHLIIEKAGSKFNALGIELQ